MITNWISAIRKILVIVAIELIDVEDLLIVTHFKARESIGNDVVFTLDIFQFRAKRSEYYAFCLKKNYGLDFYDQCRP